MKKKTTPAKSATRSVKRVATPSARIKSQWVVQDIQVRIAARAHELYVQRGCLDGYHLHDWLEAEQEILGQARGPDKTAARI
ncbi:MAG: DUF2934 domain-containing protein [Nitrospira sp.]